MKTTPILRRSLYSVVGAPGLVVVWGCASSQPAPQLVEAQRTYDEVADGQARDFAPDELLEANKLLNQAEEARNGSKEQEHFAYLADRQARLARSSGAIEHYQKESEQAESTYIQGLEQRSSSAQEQLEATQQELSQIAAEMEKKDANVEELQKRKTELEQRRSELETQLGKKEKELTAAQARAEAALASLRELAEVRQETGETVITLSGSVLFPSGKAELLPIAENSLEKVAEAIGGMEEGRQIVIEGHTDSQGQDASNMELSRRRAESVRSFLAQKGVEASRMTAVGKGESEPVTSNDSAEGRANNRRVELHISDAPAGEKSAGQTPAAEQKSPEPS